MTDQSGGHTLGRWVVNPFTARIDVPGRDAPICALLWPTDLRSENETFANARLIAASPTMFSYIERKAAAGDHEARNIMEEIHATR
ncbi:hypothetical protein HD841_000563 [Sphingomonas melonis]|uniref:Uncharacterized protein n=2 Tax=Sphingomonas melonis TaxID=152682 RepID=A0A7Y9FK44_9SPHN|nr:hypothetical protein [Sphingomonas melonis]